MRRLFGLILTIALTCMTSLAAVSGNMIGPQSQNEGMFAVPKPTSVTIDGDLGDWDWSGRIWIIPHNSVRSQFSAEVATMWDADYLYLGVKWKDPTPMNSTIDPAFNPQNGWKADCCQMNIKTDRSMWTFTWRYAPKQQSALRFGYWNDPNSRYKGNYDVLHVTEPGGIDLGEGAQMAYKEFSEGDGYAQEARIPWTMLYKDVPTIEAGLIFKMGFEMLWGDPTGSMFPILRYADNMQKGVTSREFFWGSPKPWGKVELLAKGNIEQRRYVSGETKLQGTIPIRFKLPKKAQRFTVVVESRDGKRLRNLAGDFDPMEYQVGEEGKERVVEIMWDGLADDGGIVEPGTYQVRGLYHNGLDARYEMCFYNPGTPPWGTRDSSGGWGADHSAPKGVARAGDWTILSWAFAEGGHGLIGLDPSGAKRWGEKRGARFIAADDEFLYAVPSSWHIKTGALIRMNKTDGEYVMFVKDGKELPFELSFDTIFGNTAPGEATGLSVHDKVLAVPFSEGVVALIDAVSADLKKQIKVPGISHVAYGPAGTLYGVADGKIVEIDPASGKVKALPIEGYEKARAFTVDNQGNLLVADTGADMQVKAFSPAGELVYTCGRRGGRSLRGAYDPMGVFAMSSIAVDAQDDVWVTEYDHYPRRVSVWGRDGALIREYLGNTEYAGTGCFLHQSDPLLAYAGPMEFRLDRANSRARLSRILWRPDEEQGEDFTIKHNDHANGYRFTSDISGTSKEYYFDIPYRYAKGFVFYMENNDQWRPVSAVTSVARIACRINGRGYPTTNPEGEFTDCDPWDGVFWNDANGDGKVQRSECEIVKAEKPYGKVEKKNKRSALAFGLGSGWGTRLGDDFSFYTFPRGRDPKVLQFKPIGFSKDGAPRYGTKGMAELPFGGSGCLVPVVDEDRLIIAPSSGGKATIIESRSPTTGEQQWSYPNPYPGVHGSHKATMAEPGLVIGPLKVMGLATPNDDVGKVFVMRGNLGQDFFLTTDGLYVGALFQDTRLPTMTPPATEEQLRGMPMSPFTEGGEPFNGCFVQQSDGKIRMTTGMARQASMIIEILGLKSIRRMQLDDLSVDAAILQQADAENIARAAAREQDKELTIARVEGGRPNWREIEHTDIKRLGQPVTGLVRMGYDDANLYLRYEIKDPSPWKNEGKDYKRLFKSGDCVDLKMCIDSDAAKDIKRRNPGPHDVRVLFSQVDGKAVAVLSRAKEPNAPKELGHTYHTSVTDKTFDRVELLKGAKVKAVVRDGFYTLDATVPLAALGLMPISGMVIRGDVGFILSDADGTINTARVYWSNKDTNLVNDESFEAWFYPHTWSTIRFE